MREERKRRRLKTGSLSWLLTFVMVMTLVVVPGKKAEAAEDIILSVGALGEVDSGNHAEVEITLTGYESIAALVAAGYTKLSVTYKVDSFTKTSDGETAGVQPYYAYGNSWTYNTGGVWKNLEQTTQSVELTFNATSTGAADELKRFGLQFCNITALSVSDVTAKLVYTGESGSSGGGEEPSSDITLSTSKPTDNGNYTEFAFEITNGSSSAFTGISIVIPSSTDANINKYKPEVTAVYNSEIPGYIVHYNITVNAGASFSNEDYKVGIPLGSSNFGTPYILAVNTSAPSGGGSVSDSTNLDLDLDYNYAKLLQESLYFYDANMCGDQVGEKSAFSWRDDCHLQDKTVEYNGQTVDVSGGFHDAGDHVKFGITEGYSAAVLALSYYEFGDAFDELGQTEHYKLIMDHFCDYFVNCAIYSNNDDKTGTLQAFCYNVGDGSDNSSESDHGYWGKPETQPECNRGGMTLFTSASQPATDIVSISACALALHAYNFKDSENSEKYIRVAKDLYAYANNNSKGFYSVAQYDSQSYADDMAAAAAALYLATGDSSYKTAAESYAINTGWVLCWNNTDGIVAALLKKNDSVRTLASITGNGNTAQGFRLVSEWGSCRYNTSEQFMGLIYDKNTNTSTFANWATGQMKYILGNNSTKRCFVVGYNENSSKWPHHRAASNSTDAGTSVESHHTLLGALVGGPTDSGDSYVDSQGDFKANEVALDYNATLVGATAGLYLLHKDDEDASKALATQEELEEIGGVDKFYTGGGSATPVVAVESISVTPETAADAPKVIAIGETAAATVTITPADANQNYSVASDKTSVATVTKTATGFQVAGKAAGTAAITVTASGDTTKKALYYVKVVAPPITSVSLDKSSVTLDGTGKTATVAITIAPEAADQTKISVASGDEKVATVSVSGSALTITSGSKSGTATITVSSTEDTSIKAELAVTVKHSVTGFTLDTSEAELSINGTQTVNIETVEPENADLYKALWSVDDGTIASISATEGESVTITGLKEGTTKVTAKIGTLNQSVDVTVSKSSQIKPEVTYDVLSQSSDAIRIKATANATGQENGALQLSTDKETWITGTSDVFTFDNLTSGSKYTIYARFAATDELSASQPATRTCDTYTVFDPATVKDGDAFVIDISKITAPDCDYVQMLATEVTNGIPSTVIDVTEVDSTIVITTKDGNDYVIKGSNPQVDLVIKEGSDVSLLNATLGQVKADATTTISIQENNKVTGGVSIAAGSTVTLQKKTDADASLQISNSEGSGISGEGNLKLESGDIDVSATGTNGDGIQVSDITVSGGSLVVSSEGGNGIIAQDVTISGGTVEVSTVNGKGIEADSITMSGKNTKVNVTSADSALKATDISLDGADVSLEVTGTDASVVDASDKITLSSGSITTVKPADNHNADFKAEGDIVLGTDVSVSGSGTNVFSKEPVDSNGNIIKLVNVTVKDEYGETYATFTYNANTTHVLSQEKKLAELALTQPYKELSFVNGDMELTLEDFVEVGTSDITLTIKWTPIVYTITYQLNGGTISGNKTEYTVEDKEYTLTTNVTRANYVFKGWYEDKNFKTPITFVSVEKNGNVTVYAKWEPEKPAAPRMTGTLNSEKGIVINWSAVKNVSGYEIWRSVNGGSFAKLATVTGADKVSYEDINAAAGGTKYMYRVYAYKMVDGVQAQSAASNEMKVYRVVKAATPKAANVSNGVKISWTATPGATGYYVYRSISGGRYTKVASVTSRTYTDKKATSNGKNYRYKLVAYKTVDGTTFTGVESAERLIYRLSTPKITRLANTSGRSMTVKWARNKKASGYQVQYSTSNKFKKSVTKTRKISSYKTVSKAMKKLRKGKTYYVRIMSYKKVNGKIYTSGWSKTKKVKIKK